MKKGFTLIELLAVILILGIIALIAIPAVTNVIEDAKKGSAQVTGENYVKALQDKLALANLQNGTVLTGAQSISTIDSTYENLISGEGPTNGIVIISNEKIVGSRFSIKGYEVVCTNNKCTSYKDDQKYKYFAQEGNAPTSISDNRLTDSTDKSIYIKYAIENGNLGLPQVCLNTPETGEFCLKSSSNGEEYENNKTTISSLFDLSNEDICDIDETELSCAYAYNFHTGAMDDGSVIVGHLDENGDSESDCMVLRGEASCQGDLKAISKFIRAAEPEPTPEHDNKK